MPGAESKRDGMHNTACLHCEHLCEMAMEGFEWGCSTLLQHFEGRKAVSVTLCHATHSGCSPTTDADLQTDFSCVKHLAPKVDPALLCSVHSVRDQDSRGSHTAVDSVAVRAIFRTSLPENCVGL